jgi:hypothetical protein
MHENDESEVFIIHNKTYAFNLLFDPLENFLIADFRFIKGKKKEYTTSHALFSPPLLSLILQI